MSVEMIKSRERFSALIALMLGTVVKFLMSHHITLILELLVTNVARKLIVQRVSDHVAPQRGFRRTLLAAQVADERHECGPVYITL